MAIRYELDAARRLVTVTVEGKPEVAEFADTLARLLGDPAFKPDFGRLWDMRGVTAGLSREELEHLVQAYRSHAPALAGGRVAFVATQDAFFGIARMFSALADAPGVEFATFRDPDEALRWLERAD